MEMENTVAATATYTLSAQASDGRDCTAHEALGEFFEQIFPSQEQAMEARDEAQADLDYGNVDGSYDGVIVTIEEV